MSKTRFILFPDQVYVLTFEDFDGKPFTVEALGEDILGQIRRGYALENMMKELDNQELS